MDQPAVTSELLEIEDLKQRLAEAEQLIEAIKQGEVDAFAVGTNNGPEVYTLQSGDYAYRILIEEFGEGALNVTEEGLIVYTNRSFLELVNSPYERIIGSNIFDYIDAGSASDFEQLFSQALVGKSKGEINLNINDLVIPVYVSFTSLQPNLPTIGIIMTDLTEKKKHEEVIRQYQASLEEKNVALIQSNAELGSFAYIASHDLQEPLRKIRTFSSRILETEGERFGDETKDNFNRISAASKRMQNLIIALLEYSHITDAKGVMTSVQLNKLVGDVQSNLAELIVENHAIVHVDPLPELMVVSYQVVQVFTNLVSNAIKYRKPDIAPVISISAQTVDHTMMHGVRSPKPGKYREIKVSDNGIGFDGQYAGKIFELFQRLHKKDEYSGTGIGLAICKKVMQNHHGYISAEAEAGAGATFYLYFPFRH